MANTPPLRVLIAPLNWGLGHATRCIPIIDLLLSNGIEVILASDGSALALLQKEYPQLQSVYLSGYQIRYNSEGQNFVRTMLKQVPKILYQIHKEHRHLQDLVIQHNIDIVISDNRYGCWSNKCYSLFITHQLHIKMPSNLSFLEHFIFRINHHFIKRYNSCWLPDYEEIDERLSGNLVQKYDKERLPIDYHFIGPLSRFTSDLDLASIISYDILVVLSGPEPQRSIFEQQVIAQVQKIPGKILIVRGITSSNKTWQLSKNITLQDHLTSASLNPLMLSAKVIISRSGYSTIMDLATLGKSAVILIPTPAQTEQEYLATYFKERRVFYSTTQEEFDLVYALSRLKDYTGISQDHYKAPTMLNKQLQLLLHEIALKS